MTALTLSAAPLVDRLQRVADREQTTAEEQLIQAVTEYLAQKDAELLSNQQQQKDRKAFIAAFEQEAAAFEKLKPQLLKQYQGKVVAIYQGEVVMIGDDRLAVHDQVTERYGHIPCYIESVQDETPRVARITSVWKAK
ncbi:MAG: hypothetical protein KDE19_24080 [Caldilineaceae bacterium]|nr:hypothetical protein [Caldilineaceae bacterium]